MAFEKRVARKLSHMLEDNSLLPLFPFLYRRDLGTYDALLALSHRLRGALDRGMEGSLVQLDFSAAFYKVSHRGLLCKLRSTGVGEHFLSIESEFLSDKTTRVFGWYGQCVV